MNRNKRLIKKSETTIPNKNKMGKKQKCRYMYGKMYGKYWGCMVKLLTTSFKQSEPFDKTW